MRADRRVEVWIADPPLALGGSCGFGAAALSPSALIIEDVSELLSTQVHNLVWPFRTVH